MLKYILAAVVIALVWAVVLVLALPVWIAVVATVLVVAALVALYLYRRAAARRAAREIERALSAQADQYARSVRPEQQAEIRAMEAEFNKAIGSLKTSRLGGARAGAEALYALPWYMIIGPPGAGKSTALKASGLQFPYLSASGGGVKGVGGTRNCEWWLTNQGVLLDTAGRYATEDEDRDEWLAFLDMLRQNRPRRPINGVMVAVSVADLGSAHEEEVSALARRLREKVDEVMARLGMVVPVYLLFTKCDLIPGFVEMFGDLRKQERGQIWGFTVPLTQRVANPAELFAQRFDELADVVEKRSLKRMGPERRIDTREKIYVFPQQFEVLRQNLTEFVGALFAENVYQGTPMMRGVYFTSGTQEGRPIDRVMSAMSEAFGIAQLRQITQNAPVVESRSYFLHDVFTNVIFADQDVAVRSEGELRRQRLRTYALAGGALALAALISVLPAYAYMRNRELLARTRTSVEGVAARRAAGGAAPIPLEALEPVRQQLAELYGYETNGRPVAMRFGMYHGNEVYEKLRAFYTDALRRDVLEPIVRRDAGEMDAFGRRFEATQARPTREEYQRYYDSLKTHLFVTVPREANQPAIGTPEQAFITSQLVDRWVRQTNEAAANAGNAPAPMPAFPGAPAPQAPSTVTPATQALMENNVRFYVALLAADQRLSFPRNVETVRRVRAALVNIPTVALATEQLVDDVEREGGYGLTLAGIVGTNVTVLRSSPNNRVRGAFTRRGWEERVRDRLTANLDQILGEAWVLGRDPRRTDAARREEQMARIRSEYFSQYIDEWRRFLAGLRVDEPGNNTESLAMLQELTRGAPPPFGLLFRAVAYNTHLDDPAPTAADNAAAQVQQGVVAALRRRLGANGNRVVNAANNALNPGDRNTAGEEQLFVREDVESAFTGFASFGAPPAPPPAPATPPGGSAPPTPPPAPPSSLPLGAYQEQLEFVRDALVTYQDNPHDGAAPLLTALQTARTRVEALINAQEIGWRPRFRALLWPPIAGSARTSTDSMGAGNGQRWCTSVVVPFERTLRGRYPFDHDGQDAAIADVADFFRPERGALWAFYGQTLNNDVPRVGERYEFSERLGRGAEEIYRPELPRFLNRAQDISTVMFPAGSNDPRVDFEVRIRPTPGIAQITFDVDGQSAEYHNGPEQWHTYHWPGEGRVRGASIRARGEGVDETIQQEGEWGLFRLFEAGTIRGTPSARIFSVVWTLRDAQIEVGVDVRPARSENPFLGIPRRDDRAELMRPFRGADVAAPRAITQRGETCDVSGATPAPRSRRHGRHHRRHGRGGGGDDDASGGASP